MTRPKGVVTYVSPKHPNVVAAEKWLKARDEERRQRREKRRAKPLPNYLCYREAFKGYDPITGRWHGGRLPRCRRCDVTLQPTENHVCEGFQPRYAEHDQEWHERRESEREHAREARSEREVPTCDWCGEELPTFEDYEAHMTDGCPEMP